MITTPETQTPELPPSEAEIYGEIPQSDALAEASPQSLLDLLSKDPFKFTRVDRDLAVAALRAQRAKWELAEAGLASKPRATKASPANKAASLISKVNASDLGL